ncbi:PP2C family protein-serine/threonine phosphatase [Methylomagnum sp.]
MLILVVDDDPTSRLFLSAALRKRGYDVATARNGGEAFALIQARRARLVISDWNMPELTGPELCRAVRSANLSHYVYFILLTVRNDKGSLMEGMEAGADDFLVKPIDPQELQARVRAGVRVLTLEQELDERNDALDKLNAELSGAYEIMKKDVATAAAIQKSLLPQPCHRPEAKVDWLFIPSSLLAGDMLGYFPVDGTHLAFFQIDVSGHGVSSALISFATSKLLWPERRSEIRSPAHGAGGGDGDLPFLSPEQAIAELNRRFCKEPESDSYFLTMVYGVLDTESGRVGLSSAGHPPPLLWRHADRSFVESKVRGLPVGVLDDSRYQSEYLPFRPGDRLYVYTDGIVECPNSEGELFGYERFRDALARFADLSLADTKAAVSEALRIWRGNDAFPDDISLLILER